MSDLSEHSVTYAKHPEIKSNFAKKKQHHSATFEQSGAKVGIPTGKCVGVVQKCGSRVCFENMMQNEFLSEYAENGQFLFLNMKSSTGILLRKVSLKYHAEWNENPLLKGVFFF